MGAGRKHRGRRDSNSKPSSDVLPQPNFAHRRGELREPERPELAPNPRRTNSLEQRCFFSGRIERQTRTQFRPWKPKGSRRFESTPLRHPVARFRYLRTNRENRAHVGGISSGEGDRREKDSAIRSRFTLDSLRRELSRCPFSQFPDWERSLFRGTRSYDVGFSVAFR
jgi:hypothetical protein